MSIYDQIAQGSNIGQGINAFAQNRYMVQQQQAQDQERQAQNAFARQNEQMGLMQGILRDAAQIEASGGDGFGFVSQMAGQYKLPPPDPQLKPILADMAKSYQSQGGNNIVGSPLRLGSGNYGYMTGTGDVVDTGKPYAPEIVQLGGGAIGTYAPGMQAPQTVVPQPVAAANAAATAGSVTAAEEAAKTEAITARTIAEIRADFDRKASQTKQQAQFDLPQATANAESAMSSIDALRRHPGLDYLVGPAAVLPIVPGTPQADANAYLEQIQGKAFLEAFATLKGGGQITEIEGAKATAAIARLARAQTKEAFTQSLNELYAIAEKGLQRAQAKAGSSESPQVKVDGIKDVAPTATNPATGEKLILKDGKWVPLNG